MKMEEETETVAVGGEWREVAGEGKSLLNRRATFL